MRNLYSERDYGFGQTMLTLRTEIGLTQAGLANKLCISRRAVGEWEAGNSYPKAEHLKKVIALAVQQEVFPAGREVEEIRALWRAAHQKILLDERWLSILLSQRRFPQEQALWTRVESAHIGTDGSAPGGQGAVGTGLAPVLPTVEETTGGVAIVAHPEPEPRAPAALPRAPAALLRAPVASPRVDWGDALVVPAFYGREQELALLSQWVLQEGVSLVSVLGMGGIGKSALSISSMHKLSEHFEVVIFRSLRNAPSCEALLDECLQVLSPHSLGQAQGLGQDQEGGAGTPLQPVEQEPDKISVPSSGSRKDIDSRLPAGKGYAPNPHASTGNALGTGQTQGREPIPTSTERRIRLLLEHLRKTRTLLVLDNLECLLAEEDVRGHFRPGFEGYGQLLRRVTETVHQSCLLLTSREKPADLRLLEGRYSSVRSLRLTGLDVAACKQLLAEKELVCTEQELASLIEVYGGNPLALKVVAEAITDLFSGVVSEFLAGGPLVFGSITDLLDEQFTRLSALEKTVLRWLAIAREPVTLDKLLTMLVIPLPRVQVLEAIDAGRRRSLIEPGQRPGSFTLQSVMLEYVTAVLIAEATSEITQGPLDRLIEYGLELACCKEYVRQTQVRLLLRPLLTALQSVYREQDELEERLLGLLGQLREKADFAQGYGPANLIALLRLLRGHLNGLDLSQLTIRAAYLQGIEMQDTNLSRSLIHASVWTSAVGVIWSVAISPDGKWWASGNLQGQVRVWQEGGRTLHLAWQAHSEAVMALAFSPDGRTLASGSLGGTIKLWDVGTSSHEAGTGHSPSGVAAGAYGSRGVLLWTGWQKSPLSLAFSPDGSLLASGGLNATVRLWDPQSGRNLQALRHSSGVFSVAFSPDGRLLASGCADGQLCLWERQKGAVSAFALTRLVQANCSVSGLAFAPDGRTLAGTSLGDQTVKLWEVASGRLLYTLPEHADQSYCVAWSPTSGILAYNNSDKAIWLWDVEEGRCRAVLHGHTAEVYGMVFTPDGTRLLSGGADGTLRVWDIESSRCVHVMQGYGVSLWDLDWSPDGTHLVSGGTDRLVTIWDIGEGTPPSVLHSHNWFVSGVRWSPDGRFLASCGLDGVLLLWDPISHACIQRFGESKVTILGVAWSPDGSLLACGTYRQGIQVWDVTTRCLRWCGQTALSESCRVVAWSPSGTQVAGGGEDGCVYLWECTDGIGQEQAAASTELSRQAAAPVASLQGAMKLSGHQGRVRSVVWSPDGRFLASGSGRGGSGELFIWDVLTGVRVRAFVGHSGLVSALAWCPGQTGASGQGQATAPMNPYSSCGGWLVSGDSSGTLRWWDVEMGVCVNQQQAHHGMIWSLKVSPDGKSLASCGDDGAIRIWDLESFELRQTLRRDRPYERLNVVGIRGLTEAENAILQALGAMDETALSGK